MTEQEYEKVMKAAYHLVYDDMVTKGPRMAMMQSMEIIVSCMVFVQ